MAVKNTRWKLHQKRTSATTTPSLLLPSRSFKTTSIPKAERAQQPQQFPFVANSVQFWEDSNNLQQFATCLTRELAITSRRDWRHVSLATLRAKGGDSLLQKFHNNKPAILRALLPFAPVVTRVDHVQAATVLRRKLDVIARQLHIHNYEGWYHVRESQLSAFDFDGDDCLGAFDGSLPLLLQFACPEYNWMPWLFKPLPEHCWHSMENQRKFTDWLGKRLGVKTFEDWYKFTYAQISCAHQAQYVLDFHNDSHYLLLKTVYPEYNWLPWLFHSAPKRMWHCKQNQRKYLEWVGAQAGYTVYTDWYNLRTADLDKNHGSSLVHIYTRTPIKMFTTLFPEFQWLPWEFKHVPVPKQYFENVTNLMVYVRWLEKRFGIERYEDWMNVSYEQMVTQRGSTIMGRYRGLFGLLNIVYPNGQKDFDSSHHANSNNTNINSNFYNTQRIHLG